MVFELFYRNYFAQRQRMDGAGAAGVLSTQTPAGPPIGVRESAVGVTPAIRRVQTRNTIRT